MSPLLLGSWEDAFNIQRETKAGGEYGTSTICSANRAFMLMLLCPGSVAVFYLASYIPFSFWVFRHSLHNELPRRKHLKFNSGREGSTRE